MRWEILRRMALWGIVLWDLIWIKQEQPGWKKLKRHKRQAKEEVFFLLILNEGNVQAIFNRCLAKGDDPGSDICSSKLFEKILGYDEDSKPVFFSKSRIEENIQSVRYMMGQLKSVHEDRVPVVTAEKSIYRYDGVKWTTDTVCLMKLFHLSRETGCTLAFIPQSNTAHISSSIINAPTLSPKDPNFPAWWESHKSEWETQ